MSVTVILTLRAKDDMFETLEGTMKAILPDTAARDGAELISAASDPETKTCVVYEVWGQDRKSAGLYGLAHRARRYRQTGVFAA